MCLDECADGGFVGVARVKEEEVFVPVKHAFEFLGRDVCSCFCKVDRSTEGADFFACAHDELVVCGRVVRTFAKREAGKFREQECLEVRNVRFEAAGRAVDAFGGEEDAAEDVVFCAVCAKFVAKGGRAFNAHVAVEADDAKCHVLSGENRVF